MTDSLTTELAQSFHNTAAGSAVTPCCRDVRGEWAEYPKLAIDDPARDITYLGPGGVYMTYYLDTIPKGLQATVRLRVTARIRGALICRCMDDGRTLSETRVDEPFTTEIEVPVAFYNVARALIPGIGWAVLAYQVLRAARQAYEIYRMSPELVEMILAQIGPAGRAAIEQIANSSDNLCKNMHKCADPPPPGPPVPPEPVDPSTLIS